MWRVRRDVEHPRESDVEAAVRRELDASDLRVPAGARIAVTAGSRGLHDLVTILRTAVQWLQEKDAQPFIVPSMGSHGHATAHGQESLLAQLGVNEASIGAPIRSGMDTVDLATESSAISVHVDAIAAAADGILVVNRVKPHTDFHGTVESGLAKMTAIGLGNQAGAAVLHAGGPGELADRIRLVSRAIVDHGLIIGGLAVVENAVGQTARVAYVPADEFGGEAEERLLVQSRGLLGMLPFDQLDVLVVDDFGKNISGSGMDTNVIGRIRVHGVDEPPSPRITNIVALELTLDSEGNGYGIGLADFTTIRVGGGLDLHAMYTNALTAGVVGTRRIALPMMLADDRSAISAAVSTSGNPDPAAVRLVRIHSTLDATDFLVSEALLAEVVEHEELEIVGGPASLVTDGAVEATPWP
jgi:hypothetical protein